MTWMRMDILAGDFSLSFIDRIQDIIERTVTKLVGQAIISVPVCLILLEIFTRITMDFWISLHCSGDWLHRHLQPETLLLVMS